MPPSLPSNVYTSQAWIQDLLSADGVSLRLDDDGDGSVSSDEWDRLTTRAVGLATERVNGYCSGRYNASDLVNSWQAWDAATVIAARWLCARRGNPVPDGINALYEEIVHWLEQVRAGQVFLGDVAPRDEGYFGWSNIELDQRYWLKKLRVIKPISQADGAPSQIRSRWGDSFTEY